jgi:acetyl-CoA carboxylase carboxyltransferase component
MQDALNDRIAAKDQAKLVGGQTAVDRRHAQGRLTARERIETLVDPGTFQELDLLLTSAESELDPSAGGIPSDGIITGYAEVNGRPTFVWSQDGDILGGSVGVVHAKKLTSLYEKALQMRVPIVGMVDSVGERAADLVEYPHFYSLESVCQLQVAASGVIPQIVMVMGPCVGGMTLVAAMADFLFMVKETSYMHLAGTPEGVNGAELGEAKMHARKTGSVDVLTDTDNDCIEKCRKLLAYLPQHNTEKPQIMDNGDDPNRREEQLLELVPATESVPFNMHKVINLIVDNGEFFELKKQWAGNLIIGLTRLGGQVAGIIANNPRDKAGCMTLDAADKMARFVRFCDAFGIALIWLADCPGFLPAITEETRGLIRHGSKTIYANSQATVPQITVSIRKLIGGGGLAMPGTGLGGDLYVSWPVLMRGVMGADGAAAILYKGELEAIQDEEAKKEQRKKRAAEIAQRMKLSEQQQPQDFIDPRDTRPFLINALRMLQGKKREIPPRKHGNIRL